MEDVPIAKDSSNTSDLLLILFITLKISHNSSLKIFDIKYQIDKSK